MSLHGRGCVKSPVDRCRWGEPAFFRHPMSLSGRKLGIAAQNTVVFTDCLPPPQLSTTFDTASADRSRSHVAKSRTGAGAPSASYCVKWITRAAQAAIGRGRVRHYQFQQTAPTWRPHQVCAGSSHTGANQHRRPGQWCRTDRPFAFGVGAINAKKVCRRPGRSRYDRRR